MEIDTDIRDFIISHFLVDGERALADETSLLDEGIIDSTGVLELVSFLEEHFAIEVKDEELIPENLDSVSRLVGFVEKKLSPAESSVRTTS
ncbi:acyl carrier protein [candidate division TA06 bacterium DG_24]|uniref:Acyl carrier protein n=1 Tax=candidate division TA06 bacterium DG_24 TaxID=1703770 RepID=A0A0S7WQQ3_UNCT6|nr:MAG: acyl carrier protein [candidate division TA06 bacterium DG_24]